MTVTQIHASASRPATPTEPLKVVPKPRESAPMNSVLYVHANDTTPISAVRRDPSAPVELEVGSSAGGTHLLLFLNDDADVIRLIAALQSVYPAKATG